MSHCKWCEYEKKSNLIGLIVLNNNRTIGGPFETSSGRVGKAIVLTCFCTAGHGRHGKLGVGFRMAGYGWRGSQWVNEFKMVLAVPMRENRGILR